MLFLRKLRRTINTLGLCLVEEAAFSTGTHVMSKENNIYKSGIKHLEKSLDLARSIGATNFVNFVEAEITQWKHLAITMETDLLHYGNGSSTNNMKHAIQYLREQYNKDPCANGMTLVLALQSKFRAIECERLLGEMITKSCRLNGPNHDVTIWFKKNLVEIKGRKVMVFPPRSRFREVNCPLGNECMYEALRYVENGDKCVVRGPYVKMNCSYEESSNVKTETIVVEKYKYLILPGVPVVCQGLKNASHLNGKIGDVRSYGKGKMGDMWREFHNGGAFRYCVHFEDESLKPCLVKPENVRILFDLPDKV